ncbi:MAG: hypothetical protein LBL59_06220 [Xanthomonadaceae bacterium]|nr:hypothetical protein [Xanthomonadaceae bacterium]
MVAERGNRKVALLGRDGPARVRLHEALTGLGIDIVLEADPENADPTRIRNAGPRALIVILEPATEDALDELGPVLEDSSLNVVFEEADLILHRSGWDVQRWTRHLASKLNIDADVLPARRSPATDDAGASEKKTEPKARPVGRAASGTPKAKKTSIAETVPVPAVDKAAKPAKAPEPKKARDVPVAGGASVAESSRPQSAYAPMGKVAAGSDVPTPKVSVRKKAASPRTPADPSPAFAPDKGVEIFEFMDATATSPAAAGGPAADVVPAANPFGSVLSEFGTAPDTEPPFEFQSSSLDEPPQKPDRAAHGSNVEEFSSTESDFVLSWQDPDTDVVTEIDPSQEFPPPSEKFGSGLSAGDDVVVVIEDELAAEDEWPAAETKLSQLSLEEYSDAPARAAKPLKKASLAHEIDTGHLELAPLDADPSGNTASGGIRAGSSGISSAPATGEPPSRSSARKPKTQVESAAETMSLVGLDRTPVPAAGTAVPVAADAGAVLVLAGIGGPDAVRKLLADLPAKLPRPLLVQLRLDGGRYDNLVRQISRVSNLPVQLAEVEQPLMAGSVYVLPDYISVEAAADGSMRFVGVDHPSEIIQALPPAGSAVLFLSGSDPARVDVAFEFAARGGWLAGQSLEGCYDATAVKLLAAHGIGLNSPSGLVKEMVERWG